MIYSSLLFIFGFLPVSLAVYYAAPSKLKDMVLWIESMVFCGLMGLKFLFFMILYSAVNYTAAQFIYKLPVKRTWVRLIPLISGILFDVSMLFSFRCEFFAWLHKPLNLPENFFPLGISFFTLSAIGYLLDVYSGKFKADKNFVRFSLYIMMFPRIIMGPIVSYDNFAVILRRRRLNIGEIGAGLILFIKGAAKKIVFADPLYMLYTAVKCSEIRTLSAASAWLGIIGYLFCLYFTLSGFSDMGTGLSRCFGFRFPNGFSYPVFSGRIRNFTSKWHIQVIHWFRKYITNPLCSLTDDRRINKLIFVCVWSITGFWYSSDLTGLIWGALMGLAIIIENKLRNFRLLKSNGIFYTFLVITVLSVFLSAVDLKEAFSYLWVMIGGNGIFADTFTIYLLKMYIVILLSAIYASTDLFRNMMIRINGTKFRWITAVLTPAVTVFLLIICMSLMAYTGSSGMILVKL